MLKWKHNDTMNKVCTFLFIILLAPGSMLWGTHISFTEHAISTSADGATDVYATDMDGDGDMDVLSAIGVDDKIAWYENNGSGSFTEHPISTSADGAVSVYAADVDADGDMDVLSASSGDNKITWYEHLQDATAPATPTGLAATTALTHITLTWNANQQTLFRHIRW